MSKSAAFGVVTLLAAAISATAADYGAKDFIPTPEQPIGYAADGNGWYPAATVPVQWWDGTPVKNDKGWDIADNKAKNILWKVPVPGWGDAAPIVVGDRVINIYAPHFVVCVDASTGKLLWQDALEVMALPTFNDKALTPALEKDKAAKLQTLWEMGNAWLLLCNNLKADEDELAKPESKARHAAASKIVATWRDQIKADFADAAKALDTALEALKKGVDGKDPELNAREFADAVREATKVEVGTGAWPDSIGPVASTPVSDGTLVVTAFGYGQVACHDVATGKRLWAWRDPAIQVGKADHIPSPLIYKDVAIVRSADKLFGLNKKTGSLVWSAENPGSTNGRHMTPLLLKVSKTGAPVLITNAGLILQPETGKELGKVPDAISGDGSLVGRGTTVYIGQGADSTPPETTRVIKLTASAGAVKAEEGEGLQLACSHNPIALTDKLLAGGDALWNLESKSKVGNLPGAEETAVTILGHLCIVSDGPGKRRQGDVKVFAAFQVTDVTDAAKPQLLTQRNILGGGELPADLFFDKYLPGFDKKRNLTTAAPENTYGLPKWFGVRVASLAAQGDRFYLSSQTHLYCIGPAVKGTPADDPKNVATIRAATKPEDLVKYLTDPSAQYRFEALSKMATLGPAGAGATLQQLVAQDPYEEIRAAAMRVLDQSDKLRPGFAAWRTAALATPQGEDEAAWHWTQLTATIQALGAEAKTLLPELEKLSAEKPELAPRIAPLAAALKGK